MTDNPKSYTRREIEEAATYHRNNPYGGMLRQLLTDMDGMVGAIKSIKQCLDSGDTPTIEFLNILDAHIIYNQRYGATNDQ